ncbi:alpha/beta hydrolase [Nonomuraea sp. NPDC023979]|uniref:alpha/beta hydrolase n=1 Tax=Nonomuraea sp. NPDC023979 TaxID=3154796 RepID=UPI0034099C15
MTNPPTARSGEAHDQELRAGNDVRIPRPPYGGDFETFLSSIAEHFPPTITPEMIEPLRAGGNAWAPTIEAMLNGRAVRREDRTIPGAEGGPDLTVSVFRPSEAAESAQAAVFGIHGGGFVFGDRFTELDEALDWVEKLGVVLVSVEYRLAPEHPDPAPVEDCYAGFVWMAENADELGIDRERIVIAGSSAGGGLAAGVSLLARDRSGPRPVGQLLIAPMLDERNDSLSARQFAGVGVWDRGSNDTAWNALLGDRRGTDRVTPYASPGRAGDLSSLPPAYIDVGSTETFRDESVAYAHALWKAGVQAELHVWPGVFHGFDVMIPDATISVAARRARAEWLARTLEA